MVPYALSRIQSCMGNQRNRLTKYGIVALAGIAVLGWVREPERHQPNGSQVSATSSAPAESRATFYPQPLVSGMAGTNDPESNHAIDALQEPDFSGDSAPGMTERRRPSAVQRDRSASIVTKTPDRPIADAGRHEDPKMVDDQVVSRSEEPKKERSESPEQGALTPIPRVDSTDDTRAQTQPAVVKKERSTAKSAAIIIGTAVAGAAIGAAAGGGKGATIGAISGGAGGYVFDRATRHNGRVGVPAGTDSGSTSRADADQQDDHKRFDRGSALARRFDTPSFN